MTLQLYNGVVANTPVKLTDRIKVSVPDLSSEPRFTYGPLAFDPIVSGQGGTRLPHAGDTAVVGVDDETGDSWVVRWHRDDTALPPYLESGGSGGTGADKNYVHTQGTAASTWNVVHGLNKYPSVSVVDTGGSVVDPDIHYIDANNVQLTFGSPTSGKAYVN